MSEAPVRAGRGIAPMLAAATAWGLLGPVARFAMEDGVGPVAVALGRSVVAGAAFGLHAAITRPRRPPARDAAAMLLFGATGLAGMWAAFLVSVQAGGATLAAILLYTGPVWVGAVSWALGRERVSLRTLGALLLTVAGVATVVWSPGAEIPSPRPLALWSGLAAGMLFATHFLLAAPLVRRHGGATVFAYALPAAAVVLLPFSRLAVPSPTALLAILFVGVASTYLASLFFAWAVAHLSGIQAAVAATWEPVMAALAAAALWGERLHGIQAAGAVLVIAGVLLASGARQGEN
ncbi:MAG TPA: EamA family transporter [Longimicrobium sp.]|nr:EamA family transporter [Longimicrobium sp.]